MMNIGSGGNADDSGDNGNSFSNQKEKQFQRHTLEQRQRLEEVFKNFPKPGKELMQKLSEELKLELNQITFWFQNRRTQRKNENDRASIDALKLENENLLKENLALKEKLANSDPVSNETVKLNQEHKRWSRTIDNISREQISENHLSLTVTGSPNHVPEGGRAIVTDLAHRMLTTFAENLSMHGKPDFLHHPYIDGDGVRVSVRLNDMPGVPSRFIFGATAFLLLDVSRATLFDLFDNEKIRFQWDLFTDDSATKATADIPFGTHPGNRVSIFKPSSRIQSSMLILQECYHHHSGSVIVYAPIHIECIRSAMSGAAQSFTPFLPMGFLISEDKNSENYADGASSSSSARMPGRLVLKMFFQMFAGSASNPEVSMEFVATIKEIVTATMRKIKATLSG